MDEEDELRSGKRCVSKDEEMANCPEMPEVGLFSKRVAGRSRKCCLKNKFRRQRGMNSDRKPKLIPE